MPNVLLEFERVTSAWRQKRKLQLHAVVAQPPEQRFADAVGSEERPRQQGGSTTPPTARTLGGGKKQRACRSALAALLSHPLATPLDGCCTLHHDPNSHTCTYNLAWHITIAHARTQYPLAAPPFMRCIVLSNGCRHARNKNKKVMMPCKLVPCRHFLLWNTP